MSQREPAAFAPILPTKIGYVDEEETTSEVYEIPSYVDTKVVSSFVFDYGNQNEAALELSIINSCHIDLALVASLYMFARVFF